MKRWLPLAALLVLAACAKAPTLVVPPAPPPVMLTPAPMPAGGRPGMAIPGRLPDGSWATPNRNLTPAAAVWHLRSALNVAALACRGPLEATMVADYNALLGRQKTAFASAQTALERETKAGGGDWRDRYDDQATRLYNFFAQDFARDAFCTAAAQVLSEAQTVTPAALPAFAAARLAQLERPFTDFFAAYERWRSGAMVPAGEVAPAVPRLTVDVSTLG
ncbi:MAG: hypothetical protein PGN23_03220 [Sphingomonas adhaesiva]|uniref:hypothetical protein n=1 Tax=Sphingomonas adhaesiva TaxID=28212 RepID=UPI002FF62C33